MSDKIETAAETSQIWSFRTVVARVAAAVRPLPAHVQALVNTSSAFRQCNGDLERPWGRCAVRFTCFPPASSDAAPGPLGILAGTLASFAGADGTSSRPTTCRVDCRVLS